MSNCDSQNENNVLDKESIPILTNSLDNNYFRLHIRQEGPLASSTSS